MTKHVFISYKHEDSDFAEILISRVEKAGFTAWVDSDELHPGEDWREGIDQAIRNAFALIVIMSPEAKASEYVTYEWSFAWGAGVKVIPILYKETKLHPRLDALQYLDFTNRTARPWDILIKAIKNAANTILPLPPSSPNTLPPSSQTPQKTKEQWLEAGEIFLDRSDYQEALEVYKQVMLLDHNDASAYIGKSCALLGLEQYRDALAASNQAISLEPNNAWGWNIKGRALYSLERYEEALAACEQAIRLEPDNAWVWNNKGNALYSLAQYEEALAAYEQAIGLEPDLAVLWDNKGDALSNLERYEEALAAYEQAIQLEPDNADFQNNKGNTLYNLERYEEALAVYEQAICLDPDDTDYQNNKSLVLKRLAEKRKA